MKRIFIVDDHPMVRKGIIQLVSEDPGLVVCGEADNMTDALQQINVNRPDLVIIDMSLSGGSGLDLIKHISARDKSICMLVFSMYEESLYAERVMLGGAHGYVSKQSASNQLIEAIHHVLDGGIYLSEEMKQRLGNELNGKKLELQITDRLSDRELTIFELIGEGLGNAAIAKQLNVSPKTVESHQANIKNKLGVNSALELKRSALLWHLDRG